MTPIDIVVFGATGTSGSQIAHQLARRAARGAGFTLGIAGRDRDRLEALQATLPVAVTVVPCDAHDAASVAALAARTGVVVSTVAPYVDHGGLMVGACARTGTDYLDLSAETAHIRRLIHAHDDAAQRSGARLVPTCGFDAAISDVGVHLLREHFAACGASVSEVRALYRCAGGWNAGTVASARALWRRPEDVDTMRDPFLLLPPQTPRPSDASPHTDPSAAVRDPDVGRWISPFWMGPINTRVVRRSWAIANRARTTTIPVYHEYWDPGGPTDLALAQAAAASWNAWQQLGRLPTVASALTEALSPLMALGGSLPSPGFRALFLGRGSDGSRAWSRIHGTLDPANAATAAIATEAAVLLVGTRGHQAPRGFLTPATAFGDTLGPALQQHGIRSECPSAPAWSLVPQL